MKGFIAEYSSVLMTVVIALVVAGLITLILTGLAPVFNGIFDSIM